MNYNIYCDESCHLQYDDSNVMILGALSCPQEQKEHIYQDIRNLKQKHNLDSHFEIKWTKVSNSKIDFYLELIDYFFRCEFLTYRVLVATGKDKLNHNKYNMGDYDLWYYKMYFLMLNYIISPFSRYKILVDIKDTHGGKRVAKLKEVLCNNKYDFKQECISHIGQINSNESEILQLADLLNGAIGYHYRRLNGNQGKLQIIDKLTKQVNLDSTSGKSEKKFNLFIWEPTL